MNIMQWIKKEVPIDEEINCYTQLTQRDKEKDYWYGQCPFKSNDKNRIDYIATKYNIPDDKDTKDMMEENGRLVVSVFKGIFYCFCCHRGGDVFSFHNFIHGLSTLEAIRFLITKYKLDLPNELKDELDELGAWSCTSNRDAEQEEDIPVLEE